MKLIVTIPAYNEERSIIDVIKSIPRKIPGIDLVKILVFDDGSTDKTILSARKAGADYIYSHKRNLGLARTFKHAVEKALLHGADIIVNTDADNQYNQREIGKLISPILKGRADLVIGDRQVGKLTHMPLTKKYGNIAGSWLIRILTGSVVKDASSGFRAHTRECAKELAIYSFHTYTHETIIDLHYKGLVIVNVPVVFKKRLHGKSKLITGVISHIFKSAAVIIRTILLYKGMQFISSFGVIIMVVGFLGIGRYLYFAFFQGNPAGHIQSLVLSSVLIGAGIQVIFLGFLAELISYNRRLIEDIKK